MRDLFEKPPSEGKVTWPPAEPARRALEPLPYQPPSSQAQLMRELVESAQRRIFEQMVCPPDFLRSYPKAHYIGDATFAGATVTLGVPPVTAAMLKDAEELRKRNAFKDAFDRLSNARALSDGA